MTEAAELQQWQYHRFSLVVRRGVKQLFTFVGQARVCLFYVIATVFQLCHNGDMMYEMKRMPEPTLLPTQAILSSHTI